MKALRELKWRVHCPMGFPVQRKVMLPEAALLVKVQKLPVASSERVG
jgi:hypothetical protein